MVLFFRVRQAITKILPSDNLGNNYRNDPDVTNSNRKFDVSLNGTLLSHTTNLNAVVLPLYEFVESDH